MHTLWPKGVLNKYMLIPVASQEPLVGKISPGFTWVKLAEDDWVYNAGKSVSKEYEMKESLQKSVESLRAERDELRLQMHLGEMELKDTEEWEQAESYWEQLESKLLHIGYELKDELQELKEGASKSLWKLHVQAKDEAHDLGEQLEELQQSAKDQLLKLGVQVEEETHDLGEMLDTLQKKAVYTLDDLKLEIEEELHEANDEISKIYQRVRQYWS